VTPQIKNQPIKASNLKGTMNSQVKVITIPLTGSDSAGKWPTKAEQDQTVRNQFCGPDLDDAVARRSRVHAHSLTVTSKNCFRGWSGNNIAATWRKRGEQLSLKKWLFCLNGSPEAPEKMKGTKSGGRRASQLQTQFHQNHSDS
jgi:hypothetical protein